MTILSEPQITLADSPSQDAAGRLRVSININQFNSILQYGVNTWSQTLWDKWETSLTGSATLTHLPNESAASLNLTTASGDKIVRQQHIYNIYEPPNSQQVIITAVPANKANVRWRVGYFDVNDGLFFEHDGVNAKAVIRTSTSGSPIDGAINQSAWNKDKLDGTGASGITADWTKRQIFYIDFRWLSFGRVRFGFEHDGQIIICHEFVHTNTDTVPYMKTPHLPVRYEIENTSTTASPTVLKQVCCAAAVEAAAVEHPGDFVSINNGVVGTSTSADTVYRPMLNLRPKLTYNSINNTGIIEPLSIDIICETEDIQWVVFLNASLDGSYSWVSAGDTKITEYDITNTGALVNITNGSEELSGFTRKATNQSSGSVNKDEFRTRIQLGTNIDFTSSDIITVAARSLTGTAATNVRVIVHGREFK